MTAIRERESKAREQEQDSMENGTNNVDKANVVELLKNVSKNDLKVYKMVVAETSRRVINSDELVRTILLVQSNWEVCLRSVDPFIAFYVRIIKFNVKIHGLTNEDVLLYILSDPARYNEYATLAATMA